MAGLVPTTVPPSSCNWRGSPLERDLLKKGVCPRSDSGRRAWASIFKTLARPVGIEKLVFRTQQVGQDTHTPRCAKRETDPVATRKSPERGKKMNREGE